MWRSVSCYESRHAKGKKKRHTWKRMLKDIQWNFLDFEQPVDYCSCVPTHRQLLRVPMPVSLRAFRAAPHGVPPIRRADTATRGLKTCGATTARSCTGEAALRAELWCVHKCSIRH